MQRVLYVYWFIVLKATAATISIAPLPRCTMDAEPEPGPQPYAQTLENMGAAYELLDHTGNTPLLRVTNWAPA